MQVLNALAQDEETRGIIIPNYLEDAVEKAERQNQLITASVAQSKIYNDKLIICD